MRFAAAEGRFELDDRLAVLAGNALQRLHQKTGHAFGHIGSGEEFHRVAVFVRSFAARDLRKVGGELGVAVAALSHVRMRFDDIAPAWQVGGRFRKDAGSLGRGGHGLRGGLFSDSRRTGGRTVAGFTQEGAYLFGGFRVELFTKAGHGIEGAPGIAVVEVFRAYVGQPVAHPHEFLGPGAMVDRKTLAEHLAPQHVEQNEATLDIQRFHELLVRPFEREAAPLQVVQGGEHSLPPPVRPVFHAERGADIGGKSAKQGMEALGHKFIVLWHSSFSLALDKGTLLGTAAGGAQFGNLLLYFGPRDHKGVVGVGLGVPALALGNGEETVGEVACAFGIGGEFHAEHGAGLHAALVEEVDEVLGEHPEAAARGTAHLALEFRQFAALEQVDDALFGVHQPHFSQPFHRGVLGTGQHIGLAELHIVEGELGVEIHAEAAFGIERAVLLGVVQVEFGVDGLQGTAHVHGRTVGLQHAAVAGIHAHARAYGGLRHIHRGNVAGLELFQGRAQFALEFGHKGTPRARRRIFRPLAADQNDGGGKGVGVHTHRAVRLLSAKRPSTGNGKTSLNNAGKHGFPACGSSLAVVLALVGFALLIGVIDGDRHIFPRIAVKLTAGFEHAVFKKLPGLLLASFKSVRRCHQLFHLRDKHGAEKLGIGGLQRTPHPDIEEV